MSASELAVEAIEVCPSGKCDDPARQCFGSGCLAETKLQNSPVCPHCGHHHKDAWEWNFGPGLEGEIDTRDCDNCEGMFSCYREVSVYYTTKTK